MAYVQLGLNKEERASKRLVGIVLAVTALSLGLIPQAWAQGGAKWGEAGAGAPAVSTCASMIRHRRETMSGEVIKVNQVSPMHGMSAGIHLLVKTDKEQVSLHLEPQWYLDNQDVRIAAGDRVQIKGSRVTLHGKPAIIASEVKKGDDTIKLRDDTGVPAWSGWRRG